MFRLIGTGFVCILFIESVFIVAHVVHLHRIKRHAEGVSEPCYTLVVDGKIIEHPYTVYFDRYRYDTNSQRIGYDDGRIEIPLLTVLAAIGASYDEEPGVISIEYFGKKYVFLPEKQAIYPADTEETLLTAPFSSHTQWDEHNLLLLWAEKENNIFREDRGEYIVDLSSLHKLALYMDFSFDFDCERGIVYFYSGNSKNVSSLIPPSH
jgi:hypothetical protein